MFSLLFGFYRHHSLAYNTSITRLDLKKPCTPSGPIAVPIRTVIPFNA
jgi:hypothetical protein